MNREILFRGKRVDNGQWTEGFYWGSLSPHHKETVWRGHFIHNGVNIENGYEVQPETVGQYTGLKDKNGSRIFEGDLVKGKLLQHEMEGRLRFNKETMSLVGAIRWNESRCGFDLEFKDNKHNIASMEFGYHGEEFEVVGNIHDTAS